MNVFIYARKSVFRKGSESIEVQIEECKRYLTHFRDSLATKVKLERKEDNIEIFSDEGWSGKNLERPQFKLMQKKIENGECNCLITYKLDRVSRTVADLADLMNLFEKKKVAFVSVTENIDTSSSQGKLMINIISSFAQFEREVIAERVRDNMHALAKRGRWLGGTTPLGFTSEKTQNTLHTEDGRDRTEYRLCTEEKEMETVRKIFKLFLEKQSLSQVNTYLLNNRIYTRKGNKFGTTTLGDILRNPIYCTADSTAYEYFCSIGCEPCAEESDLNQGRGFIAFNRISSDKKRSPNPVSEWIISVGKHDGIISGEDWVKAQEILEHNRDKNWRVSRNPTALLSGVLKCKCGSYMRPKYNPPAKDGERSFVYYCEQKERSRRNLCSSQNLKDVADDLICQQLLEYDVKGSDVNKQLTALENKLTTADNTHKEEIKRLEKNIKDNNEEIANYRKFIGRGGVTDDEVFDSVHSELANLMNLNREYQAEIEQLKQADKHKQNINTQYITIKDALKSFKENFNILSVVEKRELIREVVSEVIWDGEYLSVFIHGSR